MKTLVDKSLVLGGCLCLLLAAGAPADAVAWVLSAVTLSSLGELWDGPRPSRRRALVAPAAYLVAGCLCAGALPGAPLAVYDLAHATTLCWRSGPLPLPTGKKGGGSTGEGGSQQPASRVGTAVGGSTGEGPAGAGRPGALAWETGDLGPGGWLPVLCGTSLLVAVLRHPAPDAVGPAVAACAVCACVLSAVLAVRTAQEERVRDRLHTLRDDLHVRMVALQHANARLLEAQDHEVRAAALSERTRIARDIHDTVGHLLTRLTLRVKALQVLHRDEPDLVAELAELGSTLDEALGSVRSSVHALSDDGEDLAVALNRLAAGCGIEVVRVDCALQVQPPAEVSRCLVAVAREALTNAARHGRASSASVAVTDFPGFWRVTVANDGVLPDRGASGSPRLEPVEVHEDAMVAARPGRGPQRGPDAGGAGRGVLAPAGTEADGPGTGASGQAGLWLDGHWPDDPLQGVRGSAGPWSYTARGGLGLRSMAGRVESLGGTLRVLTWPRFTVLATVPREEREDA